MTTATLADTHPADRDTTATGASPGARSRALARGSRPSNKALWAGRVMSGLVSLFLLFDASMKVLGLIPAAEATSQLGYPADILFSIGIIQIVCLIAYLIPRTSVLGAILWTGYLGGAIATHVRVESPLFSHTLFPIYVAAFIWGGLWLRDERLRALIPWRAAR